MLKRVNLPQLLQQIPLYHHISSTAMSARRSTRSQTKADATPSTAVKRPAPDDEIETKAPKITKKTPTKKETTIPKSKKKSTITKATAKTESTSASTSNVKTDSTSSPPSNTPSPTGPRYWLFKSEPETRLTPTGHDVRFSLDDLISSTDSTAPWDGVRNYAARNNLRAMRLGDLGFFYHSNCKEPGIVGIVEVVKEALPDEQAFNPKACYYDPKSSRDNPKWFQVQVKFKRKTKRVITLAEMKEYAGSELSEMPLLKAARLSVSEVPKSCWDYILETLEGKE